MCSLNDGRLQTLNFSNNLISPINTGEETIVFGISVNMISPSRRRLQLYFENNTAQNINTSATLFSITTNGEIVSMVNTLFNNIT